jgi:GNAT superfamily N-acetyltransferase
MLPFTPDRIEPFLQSAVGEGWITGRRELEFLLGGFPQGGLVSIVKGEPVAFITAMRYATSAWIGNLLVVPHYRRQGFGRALMEEVLQRLDRGGCETVWLTASPAGAPLYRTLGFVQIDAVQRWRACGSLAQPLPAAPDLEPAAMVDRMGWGDRRTSLFAAMGDGAGWLTGKDAFLRCQQSDSGLQFGPWGALSDRGAGRLLEQALARVTGDGGVFLDVPQGNRNAAGILAKHGFAVSGATLLMYRGRVPGYRPELVYALASMGSYG